MISLTEARTYVLERVVVLPPKVVSIDNALGLLLAEPVMSAEAIPSFSNTAMDGFAVRSADTVKVPVVLDVVGTIAAGDSGLLTIGPGQAARIMTGAPMPSGADSVVMVEHTHMVESASSDTDRVVVEVSVGPGNHVRRPGEDVVAGEEVFKAGVAITPGHLGVLASIGAYKVTAYARPRVGVVSTGDELVDRPGPLRRGQIRDSNRRALLGLVTEAGFESVDLGIVRDDEARIERIFRRGAVKCDAVLSSGGVSMGDHDYVKVVLDRIGSMRWMQIAIKPAKPFAFGIVDSTPVFGLPGNPVSSMVSFELLAKPALRAMAGHCHTDLGPFTVPAVSCDTLTSHRGNKTQYVRVSVTRDKHGMLRVSRSVGQGSHQLVAMARADGLAVVPADVNISPGDQVDVILLGR